MDPKTRRVPVVILTALEVEYQAVREHLRALTDVPHPAGTRFEVGKLKRGSCRVAIGLTGTGNTNAAVIGQRAFETFNPAELFFVGIAGALHADLELGDVVFGTKVYAYQSGRVDDGGFRGTPDMWYPPHVMDQIAHQLVRTNRWRKWLPEGDQRRLDFRPIAAGDVVLNSQTSSLKEQLDRHFADAAAIEMESAGAARAGQLNSKPTVTIRAISDRADGNKYLADADGYQAKAMIGAAAFAAALADRVSKAQPRRRRIVRVVASLLGAAVLAGSALVLGASGVLGDLDCMVGSQQRLNGPYNIVVADPAVETVAGQNVDRSKADELALDIRDAIEHRIAIDDAMHQGLVQVGSLCRSSVSDLDNPRAESLADQRDSKNGDIAISFVLTPRDFHTTARLELSIGGNRFGEAAELAGYAVFGEIDLGNFDSATANRMLLTNAAERASVYVDLLRSIWQYSTDQYLTAATSLRALIAASSDSRLVRLVLVLIGNIEGRLAQNGDYSAAKTHYEMALKIDDTYQRAKLGLAEIAYQTGAKDCRNLPEAGAQALSEAHRLYDQIFDAAGSQEIPDVDAKAKSGIGRVRLCRLLSGDAAQLDLAIADFRYVTGRFEKHADRAWLRTAASESYGFLGLLYADVYQDRSHAIVCYERASQVAFDKRSAYFAEKVTKLRQQQGIVSPAINKSGTC